MALVWPTMQINLGMMILREIRLLGSSSATSEDLSDVLQMVADRKLRPIIFKELPLSEASEAHKLLNDKQVFGRVVLKCSL